MNHLEQSGGNRIVGRVPTILQVLASDEVIEARAMADRRCHDAQRETDHVHMW